MHPIEQQLRKVIEKAEAFDPDSRNKFYLAARETIQKLPDEKAEQAMQSLFDAVKNIEADFVRREFSNENSQPSSSDKEAAKPGSKPGFTIPWVPIILVLALMLLMAFSGYLLYTEFKKANLLASLSTHEFAVLSKQLLVPAQPIQK